MAMVEDEKFLTAGHCVLLGGRTAATLLTAMLSVDVVVVAVVVMVVVVVLSIVVVGDVVCVVTVVTRVVLSPCNKHGNRRRINTNKM